MRSRLNSTGRRRITRNHAQVSVRVAEGDDAPIFDASLDLSSYGFPDDARVRWKRGAVTQSNDGTTALPARSSRRVTRRGS